MAVATTKVTIDGQTYYPGDEIWDLGTIELVEVKEGKRYYQGLIKDFEKLPKYNNLANGSECLFLDSCDVARFHAGLKKWFLL